MSRSNIPQPTGRNIGIRSGGSITGIRPASQPSVPNFQGVSQGFEALRDTASRVAEDAFQNLERQTRQDARKQAQRFGQRAADPSKQPIIDASEIDQDSVFGQAFVETATKNFEVGAVNEVRRKSNEVLAKNPSDPQAVTSELGSFSDELIQQVPDSIARVVEPQVREVQRRAASKATINQVEEAREAQRLELENNVKEVQAGINEDIRTGNADTPGFQQKVQQLNSLIDTGESEGLLTPAGAQELRNSTDRQQRAVLTDTQARKAAANLDLTDPAAIEKAQNRVDEIATQFGASSPQERRELQQLAFQSFGEVVDRRSRIRAAEQRQDRLRKEENYRQLALDMKDPEKEVTLDRIENTDLKPKDRFKLKGNLLEAEQAARREKLDAQMEQKENKLEGLLDAVEAGEMTARDALQEASDQGLTDRDLDPYNTLLDKVADQQKAEKAAGIEVELENAINEPSVKTQEEFLETARRGLRLQLYSESEFASKLQRRNKALQEQREKESKLKRIEGKDGALSDDDVDFLNDERPSKFNPVTGGQGRDGTIQEQFKQDVAEARNIPSSVVDNLNNLPVQGEPQSIEDAAQSVAAVRTLPGGDSILKEELSGDTLEFYQTYNEHRREGRSAPEAIAEARKARVGARTDRTAQSRVQNALEGAGVEDPTKDIDKAGLKKTEQVLGSLTSGEKSGVLGLVEKAIVTPGEAASTAGEITGLVPLIGDNPDSALDLKGGFNLITSFEDASFRLGSEIFNSLTGANITLGSRPAEALRGLGIDENTRFSTSVKQKIWDGARDLLADGKTVDLETAVKESAESTLRNNSLIYDPRNNTMETRPASPLQELNQDRSKPFGITFNARDLNFNTASQLDIAGIEPPQNKPSFLDEDVQLSYRFVDGSLRSGGRTVTNDAGEQETLPNKAAFDVMYRVGGEGAFKPLRVSEGNEGDLPDKFQTVGDSQIVRVEPQYQGSPLQTLTEKVLKEGVLDINTGFTGINNALTKAEMNMVRRLHVIEQSLKKDKDGKASDAVLKERSQLIGALQSAFRGEETTEETEPRGPLRSSPRQIQGSINEDGGT